MQFSSIRVPFFSTALLFFWRLTGVLRAMRRSQRQLGSDLLQWGLGIGQAELEAEEGSFGRIGIRRFWARRRRGVNQGLSLLNERIECKHRWAIHRVMRRIMGQGAMYLDRFSTDGQPLVSQLHRSTFSLVKYAVAPLSI